MKSVLIVCTANICRSPMAAALLRHRLATAGLAEQVDVQSAGVWARYGDPASRHTLTVLAEQTVPMAEHESQPVTPQLLAQADLVLVMEEEHRRSLFHLAPRQLSKVFLLSEMAGKHEDIADPYGSSLDDYRWTSGLLAELIDAGLPNILKRLDIDRPIGSLRE
jgi:protein-tyrosine phosphatase